MRGIGRAGLSVCMVQQTLKYVLTLSSTAALEGQSTILSVLPHFTVGDHFESSDARRTLSALPNYYWLAVPCIGRSEASCGL